MSNQAIGIGRVSGINCARFWTRVNKNGPIPSRHPELGQCWVWTGKPGLRGYGGFGLNGKRSVLAHRVSYAIAHDSLPGGLLVCHHCDNPICVNPAHLFLGTDKDNADDRDHKGRNVARKGSAHANAKLTEEWVVDIFRRAGRRNHRALAREYGVAPCTIDKIVHRQSWQHVTKDL